MSDDGPAEFLLQHAALIFVEQHPERATPELLAACEAWQRKFWRFESVECATCKRCGQAIEKNRDRWYHLGRTRGCRAASRTYGRGWDDSLKRSWVATPLAGTLTRR